MGRPPLAAVATAAVAASLAAAPTGHAGASSSVAALQVALRAGGVYRGPVDGVGTPQIEAAVRKVQERKGLVVDGVAGPLTRKALGRHGRPLLGARPLRLGAVGWDVAVLQFELARHGFPSGPFDGRFGFRVERALLKFQTWAGLGPDALAGPATIRALRGPAPSIPIPLAAPIAVASTDGFGPRGARFHTGVDYPAPAGTPVTAAANGRVTYAARHPGGWGLLVVLAHGNGVRTLYAHLSTTGTRVGQRIAAGTRIGRVGSTGGSTGPHLHFEVRLRGAAVDPASALR